MELYNPKIYSQSKLGMVGMVPVLPMIPAGAQVGPFAKVHYLIDASGAYVNGYLPAVPPSRGVEVGKAIAAQPDEPSYSATGRTYKRLEITADPAHADRFLVKAGDVVIGFGVVDASAEIVSSDESIADQIQHGDDSDDPDDGDEDDPDDAENADPDGNGEGDE